MMANGICRSLFLFLNLVIFSFAAARVVGVPIDGKNTSLSLKPNCENDNVDVYDQKQNGTENLWINLDGVVVVVAPAETVLQAAQLANLDNNLNHVMTDSSGLKPKPRPPSPDDKSTTAEEHSSHNQQIVHQPKEIKEKRLRLLNLLLMFKGLKTEMRKTSQNLER